MEYYSAIKRNEIVPFAEMWMDLETVIQSEVGQKEKNNCCVLTSQSNHTRTTALSNSMKLSHARGATQDGWVMMERSDRMWSTGEGNGKPLQYSCLENPMNSTKRQNDRILKEELPRSVGAQYATGDQWRNNSRKKEGKEPKQKKIPSCGDDW